MVVATRPILQGEKVTKRFVIGDQMVDAVRDVDLAVGRGEFVAIMGPSGSGKSTLLQLLGGLDHASSGQVLIDGVDLSRLDDHRLTLLRREKTGFVFQSLNLIPTLTALENIALPVNICGRSRRPEIRERIDQIVHLMGIERSLKQLPHQLSGGQQQRVAIARALVMEPSLLFADEPTGSLDYTTGMEILELLWNSCTTLGQTIVLVSHDAKAAAFADRVLFMRDGRIAEEIPLGRRAVHSAGPLIARLQELGL